MGNGKYVRPILYLVVVILVNVAGATLYMRADLTREGAYSLSQASRDVVGSLNQPLTINVFFTSGLPAPYNNVERYVRDLLEEYASVGGSHFNYQLHDVSAEDDQKARRAQELASSYGIGPVQVQNIEADELSFQKAYMGMAIIHGDLVEAIPAITATDGLEYKITSRIRKMNNKIGVLASLEDPVLVKLYLSSSLQAMAPYIAAEGIADLPGRMEALVGRLNERNYGRLEFLRLDPSTDPSLEREAGGRDLLTLRWDDFQDQRGGRIEAGRGTVGIVVEHGGEAGTVAVMDVVRLPIFGTQYRMASDERLEAEIHSMIERVLRINEEIGYLVSHGTLELGGGLPPELMQMGQGGGGQLSAFSAMLGDQYGVKEVDLKAGPVPVGLSTLIIAGPTERFSEFELYELDQFMMRGGGLAVFLDSHREIMPPEGQGQFMFQRPAPMYAPLDTGLQGLLAHWGISPQKGYVLDESCFKQPIPAARGGGEQPLYFAPIVQKEWINGDLAFMRNIKGLIMFKTSPVDVDEGRLAEAGLTAHRLFSSSERSWLMEDRIQFNPMMMQPPDEGEGPMPMAYLVEGSPESLFKGKPIPERPREEDDDVAGLPPGGGGLLQAAIEGADSGAARGRVETEGGRLDGPIGEGRIFVIGTSEILTDNLLDASGESTNARFIMNVLDYLSGREQMAVMRSKALSYNPLDRIEPSARTLIKGIGIGGLPALVIVVGMAVWMRRASRKRSIQGMFSR